MKKSSIKKFLFTSLFSTFICISTSLNVSAASSSYTVVPGDSMWRIAVKYQIGLSEILQANPQIKTPSLIYPGQKINIPNINDVKAIENEVIKLVNVERQKAGLPALKSNWELSRVARYKSEDMATNGYFSHTSPTYSSPFTMIKNFGLKYSTAGENIAYGQRSAQEVMKSWMNSPGHRSNILNSSFTEIGVGVYKTSSGVYYWTQMFIKPSR